MEISDFQWQKFQEWKQKANRATKNRPYRGSMQRDPDSVVGYHNKALKSEHPTGERHHLVGLARMNPVFQTIETREQLGQFFSALRAKGVALGDSWEQMFELPRELHDAKNIESIHRQEAELGLDNPTRYVPENATFEDSMRAIDLIAQDQRKSRKRVQSLLFRTLTVDDSIGGEFDGFTDAILNPPDHDAIAGNRRHRQRQLNKGKTSVPRPLEHSLMINNGTVSINSTSAQDFFPNRLTAQPQPVQQQSTDAKIWNNFLETTRPKSSPIIKKNGSIGLDMGNRLTGRQSNFRGTAGPIGTGVSEAFNTPYNINESDPLGGSTYMPEVEAPLIKGV